jgi:hypothetical protein
MDIITQTYQFFNHPFFIIFGGISATIIILGLLLNIICWLLGIAPLLWRLGYGRWFRKIAIVAKNDNYESLKNDLLKSGIFRSNNIFPIYPGSLSQIKNHDLLLVHYQSFTENEIKNILANKKSNAGMVFYFPEFCPSKEIKIPDDMLKQINDNENVSVANFRGRLLNDIITTLITTSYEKR